jgi:hypothetical protein
MSAPRKEKRRLFAALKAKNDSLRGKPSPVNVHGPPELCAWSVGHGRFWFQTTQSNFARKLAKRRDARRVEIRGLNHYRQTFEIRGTRRKVERIIKRYLASAPDQFSAAGKAQKASEIDPRVEAAGQCERGA